MPDYWVVDVAAREVVVHREPAAGRYGLARRLREDETVEAALLPVRVEVAALLADVPAARGRPLAEPEAGRADAAMYAERDHLRSSG